MQTAGGPAISGMNAVRQRGRTVKKPALFIRGWLAAASLFGSAAAICAHRQVSEPSALLGECLEERRRIALRHRRLGLPGPADLRSPAARRTGCGRSASSTSARDSACGATYSASARQSASHRRPPVRRLGPECPILAPSEAMAYDDDQLRPVPPFRVTRISAPNRLWRSPFWRFSPRPGSFSYPPAV